MDNCGKDKGRYVKIVMREGVRLFIVTEIEWFSFSHKVHGIGSQANENHFHNEEVEASP